MDVTTASKQRLRSHVDVVSLRLDRCQSLLRLGTPLLLSGGGGVARLAMARRRGGLCSSGRGGAEAAGAAVRGQRAWRCRGSGRGGAGAAGVAVQGQRAWRCGGHRGCRGCRPGPGSARGSALRHRCRRPRPCSPRSCDSPARPTCLARGQAAPEGALAWASAHASAQVALARTWVLNAAASATLAGPHGRAAPSHWALRGSAARPECAAQPAAWRVSPWRPGYRAVALLGGSPLSLPRHCEPRDQSSTGSEGT